MGVPEQKARVETVVDGQAGGGLPIDVYRPGGQGATALVAWIWCPDRRARFALKREVRTLA